MRKPKLSSLTKGTMVVGACAVVLLVGLVLQQGVTRGLVAFMGLAGFAALFCSGIAIGVNAILGTKPTINSQSCVLLVSGTLASIAASFWVGTSTLGYAVAGAVGGLFVGAVSGALFRFRRKP